MKIYLIRHTSVAVETGICYGWTDVEVASTFPDEAERVRQNIMELSFDTVYSSPLSRCRKLAAFCGYPDPVLDERLKELNFGSWEMQNWEEIQDRLLPEWFDDWIHIPAGGAESYEAQLRRVACFLEELRKNTDSNVCIFTHRGVIACAMVYAGHCSAEESFSFDIPYGSITTIEI